MSTSVVPVGSFLLALFLIGDDFLVDNLDLVVVICPKCTRDWGSLVFSNLYWFASSRTPFNLVII